MEEIQQTQYGIGWEDLLNGNMALQWKETQQKHYILLANQNTGLHWVQLLIQKSWEVGWDQWGRRNEVIHRQENLVTIEELETIN
jgi:hypothetical protein